MIIDLHADTPLWMHWAGYRLCHTHRAWMPGGAFWSQVDLPRMEAAGVDAQVFGLVALPVESRPYETIHGMIDRVEQAERVSDGRFRVVRTATDLHRARADGARAGFLSMEGVHPLEGDLSRVAALVARGVISFGLAHFHANHACRPAFGLGRRDGAGLSPWGRELVQTLAEAGAIIDLTHINRRGYFEVLEQTESPVMVSHTGVAGATPHWRNLDDEQIRAVARRGGVIGVIFARNFVGGDSIDAVVRHLRHLIDVGGDAVASLGSDFDGMIVPVKGLRDVTGLVALREALRRAGLAARTVDGIMGDNALRFLTDALG